ncbi:hypothetical protein FZC76_06480 [Sutcliffiella horikoshii]|uniref:DUF3828 domain-containing protein n=1 Tax=Sutcliffiella horikoshii TaxID=79883 RepID=A0A5D4T3J5_9BACI|nr:hypothetical protein [Sutcliffiella horikoshii]TYS69869.1 hypothetical protein FZC76_06480 [Sutcliffiella horikoshii]
MNKRWRNIALLLFSIIFISGFFFLDSEEVLYNQEAQDEEEISVGQQRNIMSYIEIAKFKFHNLTMEEDYPNPEDMTREELEGYLSNYFAEPILSDLVDYWAGENEELGPFIEQFLSLSSEIEEAEYIHQEDKEVLVRWVDQKFNIEVNLTVERNGNGWIIKDVMFI